MTNEKLCIFCRHWEFSGGERGYSEVTPGADATMGCARGHWGNRFYVDDLYGPDEFRAKIKLAETCEDYSPPSERAP